MNESLPHGTVIITGASGNFGRGTIDRLLSRTPTPLPAQNLILVTRKPSSLAKYTALGANVRYGDYDNPASLREAFSGTLPGTASRPKVMLLISSTFVTKRVPQHQNAIEAAKASGVDWIVYTSFAGADPDREVVGSPILDYEGQYEGRCTALVSREHGQTEAILRSSGVVYTAIRDTLYMQTFLESAAVQAIREGVYISSFGEGRAPFVTREDCASCAVELLFHASEAVDTDTELASRRYANRHLDLMAGYYTAAEMAEVFSEVSGRPVKLRTISHEEMDAMWKAMGVPEESSHDDSNEAWKQAVSNGIKFGRGDMVSFERAVALGHFDTGESNDLEEILGRKPETFKDIMLRWPVDWKNL